MKQESDIRVRDCQALRICTRSPAWVLGGSAFALLEMSWRGATASVSESSLPCQSSRGKHRESHRCQQPWGDTRGHLRDTMP